MYQIEKNAIIINHNKIISSVYEDILIKLCYNVKSSSSVQDTSFLVQQNINEGLDKMILLADCQKEYENDNKCIYDLFRDNKPPGLRILITAEHLIYDCRKSRDTNITHVHATDIGNINSWIKNQEKTLYNK